MLTGDMMDRSNIEKIAHSPEDRVLLAKLWDKINAGIRRNIPANTCFLSPRELEMARYLFGDEPGLTAFGGYGDAERKMLCYLPDYLEADSLYEEDGPLVCLRASYFEGDDLSHRDFLGALMGAGIGRETVGDICVGKGSCDFFVTAEIAPYVLQNFISAGRTKLRLSRIPLCQAQIPEPEVKEIKDTLASLRLDSVISSGFRIGRSLAAQYVTAGKAAVDGLPCEKPDKPVTEGAKISVRGLGKIKLQSVNGQTKKGRVSVTIHRYI
ncbi:MAG: RNA-binding protein [Oscillospiraceae bacterium]|nr:RNA-binding protein [Oscillospiraceae bacterium]